MTSKSWTQSSYKALKNISIGYKIFVVRNTSNRNTFETGREDEGAKKREQEGVVLVWWRVPSPRGACEGRRKPNTVVSSVVVLNFHCFQPKLKFFFLLRRMGQTSEGGSRLNVPFPLIYSDGSGS